MEPLASPTEDVQFLFNFLNGSSSPEHLEERRVLCLTGGHDQANLDAAVQAVKHIKGWDKKQPYFCGSEEFAEANYEASSPEEAALLYLADVGDVYDLNDTIWVHKDIVPDRIELGTREIRELIEIRMQDFFDIDVDIDQDKISKWCEKHSNILSYLEADLNLLLGLTDTSSGWFGSSYEFKINQVNPIIVECIKKTTFKSVK
jgi:hypothetical protein